MVEQEPLRQLRVLKEKAAKKGQKPFRKRTAATSDSESDSDSPESPRRPPPLTGDGVFVNPVLLCTQSRDDGD